MPVLVFLARLAMIHHPHLLLITNPFTENCRIDLLVFKVNSVDNSQAVLQQFPHVIFARAIFWFLRTNLRDKMIYILHATPYIFRIRRIPVPKLIRQIHFGSFCDKRRIIQSFIRVINAGFSNFSPAFTRIRSIFWYFSPERILPICTAQNHSLLLHSHRRKTDNGFNSSAVLTSLHYCPAIGLHIRKIPIFSAFYWNIMRQIFFYQFRVKGQIFFPQFSWMPFAIAIHQLKTTTLSKFRLTLFEKLGLKKFFRTFSAVLRMLVFSLINHSISFSLTIN